MPSRAESLRSFYFGPVWRQHRDAANATMIDSDNVLLLRPGRPVSGLASTLQGPSTPPDRGRVLVGIVSLSDAVDEGDLAYFCDEIAPCLTAAGARTLACLVTEPAENTFPALTIREGANVLVWFAGMPDHRAHTAGELRVQVGDAVFGWPGGPTTFEMRALAPTRRSRLTGSSQTEFEPMELADGRTRAG